jgi:hypothetical protein
MLWLKTQMQVGVLRRQCEWVCKCVCVCVCVCSALLASRTTSIRITLHATRTRTYTCTHMRTQSSAPPNSLSSTRSHDQQQKTPAYMSMCVYAVCMCVWMCVRNMHVSMCIRVCEGLHLHPVHCKYTHQMDISECQHLNVRNTVPLEAHIYIYTYIYIHIHIHTYPCIHTYIQIYI